MVKFNTKKKPLYFIQILSWFSKGRGSVNKSILEESESIPKWTQVMADAAERRAIISLTAKEHNVDLRRDELNLIQELRKYRRSEELRPPNDYAVSRKTKSIWIEVKGKNGSFLPNSNLNIKNY